MIRVHSTSVSGVLALQIQKFNACSGLYLKILTCHQTVDKHGKLYSYITDDDEQGILSESIVSQRLLCDLSNEADKLKSMGVMNQIPYRRLVKVMTILQLNIKDGCKMVPINPVGI